MTRKEIFGCIKELNQAIDELAAMPENAEDRCELEQHISFTINYLNGWQFIPYHTWKKRVPYVLKRSSRTGHYWIEFND